MEFSPIEVFLGHAHVDKIIARKLSAELTKYSFDAFVAHEDIKIGDKWESALFEKISKCDLFIAMISKNFHLAQYTDHEVGIAYGLGKIILPLSIDDTMPYGFMTRFQAKKISPEIKSNEISKVFKKFKPKKNYQTSIKDYLVEQLVKSKTYDAANYLTRILSSYTDFSQEQINRVAEGFIYNDQIRGGWVAGPWCERLIRKNWGKIDPIYQKELV